jgi:Zinc-binding dehydrogenase
VRQPSLYKHVASLDFLQHRITTRAKGELADVLGRHVSVVARRHVNEPYELPEPDQHQFWVDSMKVAADEVIDYTRTDVTDGTRQWDVIVDTGGRRTLAQLRRALTPTGTLVIVGGEGGGRWLGGFLRNLRAPLVSRFIGQRLRMLASKPNQDDLQVLRELIEAGKLRPLIGRTYPWARSPRPCGRWKPARLAARSSSPCKPTSAQITGARTSSTTAAWRWQVSAEPVGRRAWPLRSVIVAWCRVDGTCR